MKTFIKVAGAAALLMSGLLASGSAMADHWRHGYGHGHGYGGNVRFGISLGLPIYGPAYYPAPYYPYPAFAYPAYAYPPVVVAPSAPPVYVERDAAEARPAPAQPQSDWYYCAAARAYYPYVSDCPAGWQRVPAQPPAR